MRVIIADDEPIIRMDLKEILEKEGYTVAGEAADGFDVVEMCRKEQPDFIHFSHTSASFPEWRSLCQSYGSPGKCQAQCGTAFFEVRFKTESGNYGRRHDSGF